MGAKINIDVNDFKNRMHTFSSIAHIAEYYKCCRHTITAFLIENQLYNDFYNQIGKTPRVNNIDIRKCCECGSIFRVSVVRGNFYCKKHASQMRRNGIQDRTIYDLNDYIIDNNCCYIILRDKYQNIIAKAIIDTEDYDKVRKYKWYAHNRKQYKNRYCVTKGINASKMTPIHSLILDYDTSTFIIDHINNDPLDNRKCNLRIVNAQENAMNMSKKVNNLTGVNGVSFYRRDSILKFSAVIMYKYKSIFLGRTPNFDEAVLLRIKGDVKYFKEHSNLYNPHTKLFELKYLSLMDNKQKFIALDINQNIIINEVLNED